MDVIDMVRSLQSLLSGREWVIGGALKSYGRFYLHSWTLVTTNGRHIPLRSFYLIVGEIKVPVSIPIRGSNTSIAKALGVCVGIGEIRTRQSGLKDVVERVNKWRSQQRRALGELKADPDARPGQSKQDTDNEDDVRLVTDLIERMEARYLIVDDALRQFAHQYKDRY